MKDKEIERYLLGIKTRYLFERLPEQLREPAYAEVDHWFNCADMYGMAMKVIKGRQEAIGEREAL